MSKTDYISLLIILIIVTAIMYYFIKMIFDIDYEIKDYLLTLLFSYNLSIIRGNLREQKRKNYNLFH